MTGLLVHIVDKKASPEELIRRAVKHYNNKFSAMPTHCQVSIRQTQFDESFRDTTSYLVDGVTVERRKNILLNHYFLYDINTQI